MEYLFFKGGITNVPHRLLQMKKRSTLNNKFILKRKAIIMSNICVNHPNVQAAALCAFCSIPVCSRCIVERNTHHYCSEQCAENAEKIGLEQTTADAYNYGIEFSEANTILEKFPEVCFLSSYQIPDSVTVIGDKAFRGCRKLKSITLPDSVTAIGNAAFSGCSSLNCITLPDSVTAIGNSAFQGCKKLSSITLPDSVSTIGDGTFSGCENLSSITLPDSVTAIGYWAFWGCSNLKCITLPDSVSTIGDGAFVNTGRIVLDKGNQNFMVKDNALIEKQTQRLIHYFGQNENYYIPKGVTAVGKWAFCTCENLSSITLPDSVTAIEYGAFSGCKNLSRITLPDSLTAIGGCAFCACKKLSNVTLPDSVTTIGEWAFQGCTSLSHITLPDSIRAIHANAFDGAGCKNVKD